MLTRNQLLEIENRLLAQKLNSLSSISAQPRANPAASSSMRFGAFNELNFTDPQSGPQVPIDNKNGFLS